MTSDIDEVLQTGLRTLLVETPPSPSTVMALSAPIHHLDNHGLLSPEATTYLVREYVVSLIAIAQQQSVSLWRLWSRLSLALGWGRVISLGENKFRFDVVTSNATLVNVSQGIHRHISWLSKEAPALEVEVL